MSYEDSFRKPVVDRYLETRCVCMVRGEVSCLAPCMVAEQEIAKWIGATITPPLNVRHCVAPCGKHAPAFVNKDTNPRLSAPSMDAELAQEADHELIDLAVPPSISDCRNETASMTLLSR